MPGDAFIPPDPSTDDSPPPSSSLSHLVPSYLLPWLDSTLRPPYTPIHSPKPVFAYKTVDFDLVCLEDQAIQEEPKKSQPTPQPRLAQLARSAKRRREPNDPQPNNNPDGAKPKRQRLDYAHPHITLHIPSSSLVASSTEITTFDPSLASLYPSPTHFNNVLYGATDWKPHFWPCT